MRPSEVELRRFYSSPAWQRLAKMTLERAEYVCQIGAPGCTREATEADHIVPVLVDWSKRLDRTNTRASCKGCNNARRLARRHPPELAAELVRVVDDFYAAAPAEPTASRSW